MKLLAKIKSFKKRNFRGITTAVILCTIAVIAYANLGTRLAELAGHISTGITTRNELSREIPLLEEQLERARLQLDDANERWASTYSVFISQTAAFVAKQEELSAASMVYAGAIIDRIDAEENVSDWSYQKQMTLSDLLTHGNNCYDCQGMRSCPTYDSLLSAYADACSGYNNACNTLDSARGAENVAKGTLVGIEFEYTSLSMSVTSIDKELGRRSEERDTLQKEVERLDRELREKNARRDYLNTQIPIWEAEVSRIREELGLTD